MYLGTKITWDMRYGIGTEGASQEPFERVQLGIRMEKRMVKVLKGVAEFEGVSLGQLLERIVLHAFEPLPGEEGEWSASPFGKKALAAAADLQRVYGMDQFMTTWRSRHQETVAALMAPEER